MNLKINLYPENRKVKYLLLFVASLLLFFSCYYNYTRPMGLMILMENPEKSNDMELTISGEITEISKPFYKLFDATNSKYFIVKNSPAEWKISDIISMRGKFKKEGYIEYIEGEVIWDKKIKLIISIIGLLSLFALSALEFKKLKFHF